MKPDDTELHSVRARYARRAPQDARYSLLNPAALAAWQERQRALLRMFVQQGFTDLSRLDLVEVGSGGGGNLLELLRLGFAPSRLAGVELLEERHAAARAALPEAVALAHGDALAFLQQGRRHDIVYQSTVFSSLLDAAFQQRLADAMWAAVKPGGAVLWYDFIYDNPRNPDVRGVPVARIRALFPKARMTVCRVTLAPPIARAVTRLHPGLYSVFNTLPWLRTHVLVWAAKMGDSPAGRVAVPTI